MSSDTQQRLFELAFNFRLALEKLSGYWKEHDDTYECESSARGTFGILSFFPLDCCDKAAMLIVRYLYEQGFTDAKIVNGVSKNRGSQQHQWVKAAGYIVDITADQFANDEKPPKAVIVVKRSSWHEKRYKVNVRRSYMPNWSNWKFYGDEYYKHAEQVYRVVSALAQRYANGNVSERGARIIMSDLDSDKIEWRQAQSFDEICKLGAHFVLSEIEGWGADEIYDEADPIKQYLAALNRAGYLTTSSQPGYREADSSQRAYIMGFAKENVARKLVTIALYTDLIVFAFRPEESGGYQLPVSVIEGHASTWNGMSMEEEREYLLNLLTPAAAAEFEQTWFVNIIDPQWGRESYLWTLVMNAICYSSYPTPDLGLDTDFVGALS